jgi:heme/copper-type cytochrome/quinol oxidase subunit 3
MTAPVINVKPLPEYAFGHRSMLSWSTLGLFAIEGMVFALMIANYLYLKGREPHWPPGVFPPDLLWGTVNTAILLASLVPNQLTKRAAEDFDIRGIRIWLSTAIAFAVLFNAVRILEFQSLNVWWDTNAYGSVVWTLLGLHTAHLLTDLIDSAVLCVLFVTGPLEEKRFVDVSENSFYWYFVVAAWLPIYALIYLAPRLA